MGEYKTELHRDAKTGKWTYPGWRADVGMRLMTERWMLTDSQWASELCHSEWAGGKVYFQRAQAFHEKMPERLPWVSARSYLFYIALCFVKQAMSFVHFLDGGQSDDGHRSLVSAWQPSSLLGCHRSLVSSH